MKPKYPISLMMAVILFISSFLPSIIPAQRVYGDSMDPIPVHGYEFAGLFRGGYGQHLDDIAGLNSSDGISSVVMYNITGGQRTYFDVYVEWKCITSEDGVMAYEPDEGFTEGFDYCEFEGIIDNAYSEGVTYYYENGVSPIKIRIYFGGDSAIRSSQEEYVEYFKVNALETVFFDSSIQVEPLAYDAVTEMKLKDLNTAFGETSLTVPKALIVENLREPMDFLENLPENTSLEKIRDLLKSSNFQCRIVEDYEIQYEWAPDNPALYNNIIGFTRELSSYEVNFGVVYPGDVYNLHPEKNTPEVSVSVTDERTMEIYAYDFSGKITGNDFRSGFTAKPYDFLDDVEGLGSITEVFMEYSVLGIDYAETIKVAWKPLPDAEGKYYYNEYSGFAGQSAVCRFEAVPAAGEERITFVYAEDVEPLIIEVEIILENSNWLVIHLDDYWDVSPSFIITEDTLLLYFSWFENELEPDRAQKFKTNSYGTGNLEKFLSGEYYGDQLLFKNHAQYNLEGYSGIRFMGDPGRVYLANFKMVGNCLPVVFDRLNISSRTNDLSVIEIVDSKAYREEIGLKKTDVTLILDRLTISPELTQSGSSDAAPLTIEEGATMRITSAPGAEGELNIIGNHAPAIEFIENSLEEHEEPAALIIDDIMVRTFSEEQSAIDGANHNYRIVLTGNNAVLTAESVKSDMDIGSGGECGEFQMYNGASLLLLKGTLPESFGRTIKNRGCKDASILLHNADDEEDPIVLAFDSDGNLNYPIYMDIDFANLIHWTEITANMPAYPEFLTPQGAFAYSYTFYGGTLNGVIGGSTGTENSFKDAQQSTLLYMGGTANSIKENINEIEIGVVYQPSEKDPAGYAVSAPYNLLQIPDKRVAGITLEKPVSEENLPETVVYEEKAVREFGLGTNLMPAEDGETASLVLPEFYTKNGILTDPYDEDIMNTFPETVYAYVRDAKGNGYAKPAELTVQWRFVERLAEEKGRQWRYYYMAVLPEGYGYDAGFINPDANAEWIYTEGLQNELPEEAAQKGIQTYMLAVTVLDHTIGISLGPLQEYRTSAEEARREAILQEIIDSFRNHSRGVVKTKDYETETIAATLYFQENTIKETFEYLLENSPAIVPYSNYVHRPEQTTERDADRDHWSAWDWFWYNLTGGRVETNYTDETMDFSHIMKYRN